MEVDKKLEQNQHCNMDELEKIVNNACTVKIVKPRTQNSWWDKECENRKRDLRKLLREVNKGEMERERYLAAKKNITTIFKNKKEIWMNKQLDQVKNIKTETQLWKYIGKWRAKSMPNNEISLADWKLYFMQQMDGVNEQNERYETANAQEREETIELDKIEEEEVRAQINKLKKNKAAGTDGMQQETIMFGTEKLVQEVTRLFNEIWKKEKIPEKWKEGIIVPIFKKGEHNKVENYRGITLLNTLYKLYARILEQRLTNEIESKNLLAESQMGFRKGKGATEAIYLLNYIIEKTINRKGEKLYACFIDLKAAFDKVNRKELIKTLKRNEINEKLTHNIAEIYEETKNKARVDNKNTEWFWTTNGLRQGCPLSPTLFNLYIGDLEKEMQKEQTGGVVIGSKKIWSISYADDIVIIAKSRSELRNMLLRLEKYMDRKSMILNTDKTKIMIFGKRGRKAKADKFQWKEKELEIVKEFKYLGIYLQYNNKRNTHLRYLAKKARTAMAQVWSIGRRKLNNNFKLKMAMFDAIVRSVILYGAEIYGWKEEGEMETIQHTFIKWTLGLDRCTPEYIVRQESAREKIRILAFKRALKFEAKLRTNDDNISQELLREIEREVRYGKETNWGNERRNAIKKVGYTEIEITRQREMGRNVEEDMVKRLMGVEGQLQWGKINSSNYNPKYKYIAKQGLPDYLLNKNVDSESQKLLARFRCGNEEMASKFWLVEDKQRCRICGEDKETLEHMVASCRKLEGTMVDGYEWTRLLGEDGNGMEAIRFILERRKIQDQ